MSALITKSVLSFFLFAHATWHLSIPCLASVTHLCTLSEMNVTDSEHHWQLHPNKTRYVKPVCIGFHLTQQTLKYRPRKQYNAGTRLEKCGKLEQQDVI